ncbi:MAG: hypothetical protein RL097_26 [Candidatus Parcubacteria bacterium]|jgi:hypothetical protein
MTQQTNSIRGAAMLIFVLFFAFTTSALLFILGQSIFSDLADFSRLADSKQAFFTSESLTDDVVYRLVYGTYTINLVETLAMGAVVAYSTTTYDSPADVYTIETAARKGTTLRKSMAEMSIGAGSAFNYGLQAGNGGIQLANNSRIIGNVYSNGTVQGAGSAEVLGDIVSAGPAGLIADIAATGSVFANTIDHIEADKDAHYNVQIGTNAQNPVGGTRFTPWAVAPTSTFPVATSTIQQWKDAVIEHGTVIAATDPACSSGTYTIDTNITIGFLKVECNLDIVKTGASTIVTLTGPVWVQGNLSFTQGPTIRVHPSIGRRSVQMIADNPTNRLTSSQIEIRNATNYIGSGDSRSYIMLLSMNESAETGGADYGIRISQSANGSVIAYTNSGLVEIGNGIDLRAITGYQINVAQNTDVIYEIGLASLLFTSGPGGGYILNDWQQAQ